MYTLKKKDREKTATTIVARTGKYKRNKPKFQQTQHLRQPKMKVDGMLDVISIQNMMLANFLNG